MSNIRSIMEDWNMNQSYRKWEYYETLKKAAIAVLEWEIIDEKELKLSKPFNLLKVGEKNLLEDLEKIHDFISKLNEINTWKKVETILETFPWVISSAEALNFIKNKLINFIK